MNAAQPFPSPLRGGARGGGSMQGAVLHASPLPDPPPQGGRESAGGAVVQELTGERLHLSHGPIDVVLKAYGKLEAVERAYRAAVERFPAILPELCAELPLLRRALNTGSLPQSSVGRRMHCACLPFAEKFITPMAAVAGSVADELMAVMRAAAPLDRAYVNDGGDIAVYCAPGQSLDIAIAGDFSRSAFPSGSGTIRVRHGDEHRRHRDVRRARPVILSRHRRLGDGVGAGCRHRRRRGDFDRQRRRHRPSSHRAPPGERARSRQRPRQSPCHGERRGPFFGFSGRGARRRLECAADYLRRGLIIDAALTLQGETVTLGESLGQRRIVA